mgnify:FL=1
MSRKEDIQRIKEALNELHISKSDDKVEELWEIFCHDGFEQEWIPTTDEGLQLFKAYVDDVDTITLKEVVKLQEPFIYFLLWLVKVYKETD